MSYFMILTISLLHLLYDFLTLYTRFFPLSLLEVNDIEYEFKPEQADLSSDNVVFDRSLKILISLSLLTLT